MTESDQTNPAFMSAIELARLVRLRKIGCLELLDVFIERIGRLDESLNALAVRDFDVARARALNMDALPADAIERHRPLFGVPMTVKESFDLVGQPTTWGLSAYRNNRAGSNALAVDRLLASGANILGKTNVPVLLADWQTANPIYGRTNNPWNLARAPGGSSGGSAAALAAGFTALEIGSDLAGSIRNPAHYCGVFGHKSTWGICPRRGHSPWEQAADSDISVIGPLARSADDLRLALSILSGPDEIDGAGWQLRLPKPRHAELRGYRVAVLNNLSTAEVDLSVQAAVSDVADFLAREGATVSYEARPDIDPDEVHEAFIMLMRAGNSGRMTDVQFENMQATRARLAITDRGYAPWLTRGSTMTHREWLNWNERRHRMRLSWAKFFQSWDVLLCPVAATAATPHNQEGERWERMIDVNGSPQPSTTQLFWAGYSGLCLLPSTVAPVALSSEGLPIGVQIVGPQYGDLTTISLARHLERGYRAFSAPPMFV